MGDAMMTKLPVSMYESPKVNIEVKLADDDETELPPEGQARRRKETEKRSFSSAMARQEERLRDGNRNRMLAGVIIRVAWSDCFKRLFEAFCWQRWMEERVKS
jgi:hypothetical protein